MNRRSSILSGLVFAAMATPLAQAQAYPDKHVRLVVPYAAGGAVDGAARALGAGLTAQLGQAFIVENKPGANGAIGAVYAATSPADGYTLFLGNADTQVVNPLVNRKTRYNPVEQFEPIGEVGRIPMVMVVRNGLKVRSQSDLLKLAKDKPGAVSFGSWGIGSTAHLALAMLEQGNGVQLNHIPYTGAGPIYTALMGGFVDMTLAQVSWATGAAKEGKVQILGVTSARRTSLAPELPTLSEAGFVGYAVEQWVALYAPKGTPAAVREKLAKALAAWQALPEARSALAAVGIEAGQADAGRLSERQRMETQVWSELVRQKNIHIDD
jgi:tripartite-type tricarboxylate transporter receptor subunit TctC